MKKVLIIASALSLGFVGCQKEQTNLSKDAINNDKESSFKFISGGDLLTGCGMRAQAIVIFLLRIVCLNMYL